MEKKTIGAFIAALRKANGLTQKQLADTLCVSDKAVSRWERDETLPDLTLIPVMAEIFGVTSDELLRGQRANPDIPLPNYAPEKSEKQLRRIITAAKTKFKIQSIISVAVAFPGLIAALICNFAFSRAHLGFLLGCAFYSAGLVCQVIFTILIRSHLDTEELDPDTISAIRKYIHIGNELTFSSIAMLLSLSLPLLVVPNPNWFLTAGSYITLSLLCCLGCAALCAIVCLIINIRLGHQVFSQKAKVRLVTIGILIPALGITWLGHYFGTELLYENRYLLAGHSRYDKQDFQEFTENLVVWTESNNEIVCVDPDDGTIYTTIHKGNVFYTFTREQADTASRNYQIICIALFILYPMEIAAAIYICRKKIKALPKDA